MLNPTLRVAEYCCSEARVVYAILPPHAQASFTSITPQGSIGVSFTGHRRAAREYEAGGVQQKDIEPGAAFLTMSSSLMWLDVAEPADALEIHFEPSVLGRAAASHGATGAINLHDVGGTRDPVVWGIAALFRAHLRGGSPLSDVRASELLTGLTAHVLRKYGGLLDKDRAAPSKLDTARLRRVDDFIDSELGASLTISQLAAVTTLSPFHFARLFRSTTGLSPHLYVTAKRMERARHLSCTTALSTADLAHVVGYTHVAHFREAFTKFFGMTPARYRRERTHQPAKISSGS